MSFLVAIISLLEVFKILGPLLALLMGQFPDDCLAGERGAGPERAPSRESGGEAFAPWPPRR